METSVERMKEIIRRRLIVGSFLVSGVGILIALQVYNMFRPFVGGENYADFLSGVQLGLLIGVDLVAVFFLAKYLGLLKDEKRMRESFVQENDERNAAIAAKVGVSSYGFTSVGLVVAAVVAGYFSIGAFVALLGAMVFEVLVRLALYLYYSRRF